MKLKKVKRRLIAVWSYMAATGCTYKIYAYKALGYKRLDFLDCAACEYALDGRNPKGPTCKAKCPIPWGGGKTCTENRSLYSKWVHAGTPKGRKRAAKKILKVILEMAC